MTIGNLIIKAEPLAGTTLNKAIEDAAVLARQLPGVYAVELTFGNKVLFVDSAGHVIEDLQEFRHV